MAYAIRPFRNEDAQALADLTLAAIRTVGPKSYSSEQVEVWASRHPGPKRFVERAQGGSMMFVAVGQTDIPVAYSLLETDGHLDMLYCHPDHTRQGLANRLIEAPEHQAQLLGLDRLYTEASELARPAFERAGYVVDHRRDFELDGVPIHNFAMKKRLD